MATAGIEGSVTDELEARIARSSQGIDRPLLRFHFELPSWDPWRFLEHAQARSRPWFAWSSRDGDHTFVTLGAVAHMGLDGAPTWRRAASFCSEINKQLVSLSVDGGERAHPGAPLIVGGFGFDPLARGEGASPWGGWSSASLWIPEVVLALHNGVGEGCLVRPWSAGESPDTVAAWARAQARSFASPPPASRLRPAARAPKQPVFLHEERQWNQRVEGALEAIREGAAKKIVLARTVRFWAGAGELFDVANTLRALKRDQPDCDVFAVGHPDGSVFLGASPEPLLEMGRETVRTVALAGTVGRGTGPDEDSRARETLLASEKDGREHALVVDAIVGALGPVSDRMEVDEDTRVRSLTQVHHLETAIEAHLEAGVDVFHVLERLHPTPATCGWPQEASRQWIAEHEGMDRGWYAGPVGWLDGHGDGRFSVALRSALVREDEAHAFIGAGLVEGSTPEGEWRETEVKLEAIAQSLMTRTPDYNGGRS